MTDATGPTLGEAGERAVLAAIGARFTFAADVEIGPGDDAAVLQITGGRVVATTDVLVEDRHFRRAWSSAYDIGRRAAAQNLIDVAAMGARPTALLVGLAAPADLPLADAVAIADGLQAECGPLGASVIGGDLVRADSVMVSVTALGVLDGRPAVLRSGAQPGDVVVCVGRLGWSAAGLALLSAGSTAPSTYVDAFRCPSPPYDAGVALAAAGARAMCDVSDGLVQDLGNIARASGVAIELDLEALQPADELSEVAASLATDPLDWVLGGGEDHALVACLPPGATLAEDWRVVGTVDRSGAELVTAPDRLLPRGWDSFRG